MDNYPSIPVFYAIVLIIMTSFFVGYSDKIQQYDSDSEYIIISCDGENKKIEFANVSDFTYDINTKVWHMTSEEGNHLEFLMPENMICDIVK